MPTNKRAIARQATSAVAYTAEPPAEDDPLLSFTPVPHKQPRRNSITPDLQRRFIAHLAATGIVTAAARAAAFLTQDCVSCVSHRAVSI